MAVIFLCSISVTCVTSEAQIVSVERERLLVLNFKNISEGLSLVAQTFSANHVGGRGR